jgi:hypothetical protein
MRRTLPVMAICGLLAFVLGMPSVAQGVRRGDMTQKFGVYPGNGPESASPANNTTSSGHGPMTEANCRGIDQHVGWDGWCH